MDLLEQTKRDLKFPESESKYENNKIYWKSEGSKKSIFLRWSPFD